MQNNAGNFLMQFRSTMLGCCAYREIPKSGRREGEAGAAVYSGYLLKCVQWWIACCGYRCLNELPSIDRTETFFPPMLN